MFLANKEVLGFPSAREGTTTCVEIACHDIERAIVEGKSHDHPHIGSHPAFLQKLAEQPKFAQWLGQQVSDAIHRKHTYGRLAIVFTCDWGKHRSLVSSVTAQQCLAHYLQWPWVGGPWMLSLHNWSKRKCGWRPCEDCEAVEHKRPQFDQLARCWGCL